MKNHFVNSVRYFFLLMLSFTFYANAKPEGDIRIGGHVPTNILVKSYFLNKLPANQKIGFTFALPLRHVEELEQLVKQMYDPSDLEHYGKYLSTEEFIERFAPSQEDYEAVIAYAKAAGLRVKNTHANRTLLNVVGQVRTVEEAFKLQLNMYQNLAGRKFHAPTKNPSVPASIASVISGVVGLDNVAVWRPFHTRHPNEAVHAANATANTFPSGPNGGFAPADIIKAYNLTSVTAKGSGQAIALFELASYSVNDINTYTAHFGLPTAQLHNVLVDGGSSSGIDPEVTLDIELALALSPQSQIYVYEGPNSNQGVLDTYNRIATDNIAKQVSTSWGLAEDLVSTQYLQAENAIFLQMAAHGQTIYAAAGDSGAYDDSSKGTPVVDDPASQPYVVGVGGTHLSVNSSNGAYVSESVWNNGAGNGAGGGGVSQIWAIPSWQQSVATASSHTHRNVPDVALDADPNSGYAIYYNGQWTIYGGTSCAAPLWAAFTACVNQQRTTNQLAPLGFANPVLYTLAQSSSYPADFHDVTTGNNLYYSAGTGYDNATGWGSFNGANLFASLVASSQTSPPSPPPPPPSQVTPVLQVTLKNATAFYREYTGTYSIIVKNSGNGPTSETVSVAVSLPSGLTYKSFSGSGWTYNAHTATFTRTNTLAAGATYPPISLSVGVSGNAPSSVTTRATVSGGGSVSSTVSEVTTILRI